MALREVKYRADPKPVRSAEGTVPLQRLRAGCGDRLSSRRQAVNEERPDCCTRVFKRSRGCKMTAEARPEPRPETKCTVWAVQNNRQANPPYLISAYIILPDLGRVGTWASLIVGNRAWSCWRLVITATGDDSHLIERRSRYMQNFYWR